VRNTWICIHAPLAELKPSEKEITDHEVILKEIGKTPLPRLRTRYSYNEDESWMMLDHDAILESGGWREWMFLQDEEAKNILEDKECWRDVTLV
jgi:hypothetical protein